MQSPLGFSGGSVVERSPAGDVRDAGSIPGSSNPLQYSCLESPMDRGAWQSVVHGVTEV